MAVSFLSLFDPESLLEKSTENMAGAFFSIEGTRPLLHELLPEILDLDGHV